MLTPYHYLVVVIPHFLFWSSPPHRPSGNPQIWSHRSGIREKMRDVSQIRMVRFSSEFGFCVPRWWQSHEKVVFFWSHDYSLFWTCVPAGGCSPRGACFMLLLGMLTPPLLSAMRCAAAANIFAWFLIAGAPAQKLRRRKKEHLFFGFVRRPSFHLPF